ncbi:MAG: hypothetical protein ACI8QZ_001783 [Chlamydiales bacterium]|jgi:hypothetical protein
MISLLLAQSILLSGGTVHSMEADVAARVADVSIDEGRIVAIGPVGTLAVAEDARTIDVSGLHILPGLIDGMVNHDPDHDLLYVSAGVTLVRDTGNQVGRILQERKAAARERAPGPALFVAGPVLDGDPPSTTEAAVLRTAAEVDLKLAALLDLGLDFLSFQEGLPREAWERTLAVAHERGLQVWGPLPDAVALDDLIEKSQDGLFGLHALLPKGLGWHDASLENVRAGLEVVQSSKLKITPLLAVHARLLAERDPAAFDLISPHYEIGWRAEGEAWTAANQDLLFESTDRALTMQYAVIKRLVDAGVPLVPGSAAPNSWLMPGTALHDELEQWIDAGLEPIEVLRMATAGAAEALGIGEQRGTLAAGMVADLLVVDGDPRDSLDGLRRPQTVVLRGRVLERAELDEKLDALKASLVQVREQLALPLEVDPPDVPDGDTILSGRSIVEAYGQRVSAESFAVVRTYDGRTAYCTRLRIPNTASKQGSELQLVQRYYEGRLEGFDLRIDAGEVYTVEGRLLGGIMNVQRRLGEIVIDSKRAREPISLVDVSSVLTPMLIAQQFIEGPSFVLTFRGLDVGTDRWWLEVGANDHTHKVKTTDGWIVAGFDELGVPLFQIRRTGKTETVMRVEKADAFGGPGLGLDPKRVYVEPVEAAEASAQPTPAPEPADVPADSEGPPPTDVPEPPSRSSGEDD